MEETKLPPLEPVIEPDSLDAPGAQVLQPEASYGSSMQYPVDELDVHVPGVQKQAEPVSMPTPKYVQLSRRRALVVSLIITLVVVLLTGLSAALFLRDKNVDQANTSLNGVSTQDVQLDQALPTAGVAELQGTKEALLVNGNVITRGELQLVEGGYTTVIRSEGGTNNATFVLPSSSGTLCVSTNNCSYASQNDLLALQNQLGQIVVPQDDIDVSLLNNQSGALSIQGVSNQISVSTGGGVITLSTPQDIAAISSPTFANLLLTNNLTVNGVIDTNLNCTAYANQGTLTTNASGQIICADDDGGASGVSTPGGTAGVLAVFTAGQTIADSIISQALGTATVSGNFSVTGSLSANTLSLVTALGVANGGTGATTLTSNGVVLGNGAGALSATSAPGLGQVLLGNAGGVPTFTTLSGDIAVSSAGVTTIQANSVALTTDTTGNYVANLVAGNGISVGAAGEGATPSVGLSVLTSNWDQTGAFDIVLNNAASELRVLESTGATFFGTFDVADLNADRTYTFPDNSGTVCLDSGNCVGGSGGAPNSASYLTLTNDATLSNERSIATGTNLTASDGGANGAYTLGVVNNPSFSGLITAAGGLDLGTQTLQGTTAAINLNNFDVDSSGNITNSGTYNGQTIGASSSFTGSLTVTTDLQINGNTVLGNAATDTITIAGVLQGAAPLVFEGITSDTNQITIAVADPSADLTYTIPFVGSNADFCLSTGNCAGAGGGVTTAGGNTNRVAKFTSSQAIGDSTITDDGTNVSISGNFALQGGALTIGTVSQAGSVVLHDGDGETVSLNLQDVGANYTLTLPSGLGSANQCLKAQNGTGTLYWDDCLGGGGAGGISSIDGQSGPAISISNASGSSNIITIDDALADGSTKGIAAFNATNFSAAGGVVNTAQNINTTATPTFGGLTLNGAVNLGTNTLQGTTAIIDFSNFDVASNGNVTAGTYNGQTISSSASLTGSLDVAGLLTVNGGLTVQAGDTLTVNSDAITDLTGNGLQVLANSLTLSVQANKGLEVDGNGLSLIDCSTGEILKYNGSNQWACDSDAGGSGLGDNVSVNGTGATDANFIDTTATGSVAGVTWLLSNVPNPDEISLTIGVASGTEAGVVTTGVQTFAGDKTFSGLVTLNGNVSIQNGDTFTINGDGFTDLTGTGLQITAGSLETTLGTSIDLTAEITGTLGVSNGGTGVATLTSNGILFGNGAGAIQATSAAADSILATNGSNVPSLVQTLPTTVQGNITSVGTIASGVWNGTAIIDTYVADTLTVDASSTVAWAALNSYPAACAAGEAVTQLGDTITCTAFAAGSGSGNYIQNQNAGQQSSSNFWISGSGRADTSFLSPIIDTPSAGTLTVGGTNATAVSLADDTTVAAGKFLRITGDNTAGRPASPSAGMLFYDTTTNQLLQYNGSKWVSDRSSATKIVAASNSSQAQKDGADYVTDGTADEVEINAALVAAAGGRVYLHEGTYTIAAAISVPNNTTLAGAGRGTLVTVANSFNASINAITNTTNGGSGTGITLRDLRLDGNSSNQSSGIMHGIYLDGVGSGSGSSAVQGAKVTSVWTNNWRGSGVLLTSSANSSIVGSTSQGNTDYGFYLESSSGNNTLTGNTAQGNSRGIYLFNSSNNTVSSNNSQGNGYGFRIGSSNNNTISGNTALGNTSFNFSLTSGSNNTLSGNTTYGSSSGFSLTGTSEHNVISANTIQSTSASAILLDTGTTYTTVANNNIIDSGGASSNAAISMNAADNNSIIGNSIYDSSATVLNYAIDINDSGADNNYLADNYFNSGTIHDIGTGTVYGGQVNGSGNFVVDPSGSIELQSSTNITGSLVATGTGSFTGGSLTVATTTATDDRIITSVATGGAARFDGTITNTDLTAARTWTLPNESGTFCMQGSANCGFATGTSASYIQNQNAGQQSSSNFWISGSGRADTSFLSPIIDTPSAGTLTVGGTNATAVSLADDTTVAAGKFLRITGDNTAGRPASPSAGMLFYDTTTNQLLQYNGSKWVSDRSSATKIVAPSTAGQAAKDSADYVLTGTADQTIINTALTAATGGRVYILDGTVTITDAISVPDNTTLSGSGYGTLIQFGNVNGLTRYMVINSNTSSGTGVAVRDLRLDGNDTTNTTGTQYGVYFNGMGSSASGIEGGTITNIWVTNLLTRGIALNNSNYVQVVNNYVYSNSAVGIYANGTRNTIINNNVHNNGNYGIALNGVLYSVVNSNQIHQNTSHGLDLSGNSSYNTVNSNSFRNNGGATTNDSVHLSTSTNNVITSNSFTDANCSSNCYAINISDAASTGNYISDNYLDTNQINATSGSNPYYGAQLNVDGSGSLFLNNTGSLTVDTSNFDIAATGAVTAAGNYTFTTGADRTISVQTQTASNTAGNNLTVQAATGNGTGAGGNAVLQAGTSGAGATGNGGIAYIYGGNAGSTNGSGGNIVLTPGTKTGSGSSGQVLIKPASSNDASNTLQVQNAAGTNILQVGTSDQTVLPNLATNGSVEQNTTNWVARTGTTMTRTSTYANTGSYSVSAATNAVDEGLNYSMPNLANGTYIFTAYVRGTISSSVELGYSADGSTETSCAATQTYSSGGWRIVKCGSFTATSWNSSAYIFIRVNSATSQTIYIDGLQIASGTNIPSFANGQMQLDAMITSRLNVMLKEDSESAFSVQTASGNGVFSVNTERPRVGIGLDQPNAMLHIARLTTSDDLLRVTGSGATLFNVFEDGSNTRFSFTTANNNTTAFRVMNSSSNAALTVDTTNNRVKIDADTQYTERLCHSGTDAAAQADITLGDCNAVGQADLAEMYDTNGNLEPGDVVFPVGQYKVDKTTQTYQSNAMGVVSTNPIADGIIGNNVTSANRQPVALAGRIPVKVSLENGPIVAGDYLAAASTPGFAMKATAGGRVIGVALEDYDGSQPRVSALVAAEEAGRNVVHASDLPHYVSNPANWPANTAKIMVFANATYYAPTDESILQGSDMTLTGNAIINGNMTVGGSLNVSGATTLVGLTVTGSVQVQGSLVVVGNVSAHNIVVGGHIITAGDAPQVYVGLGAGMNAQIVAIEGNDTSGTITILTGTNPAADELARLEFSESFGSKPRITLTPANRETAKLGMYYEAITTTQNEFRIMSDHTPEPAKTYVLTYFIVQ